VRAITIWQPFADLIIVGRKICENRSWRPHAGLVGQRVAIHAGLTRWTPPGLTAPDDEPWPYMRPRGVIVGTAILDAAIGPRCKLTTICPFSDPESWRWIFRAPRRIEPVPCKGRQGVWTVPDVVLALIPSTAQ